MKKIMMTLTAVFCCAMAISVLSSCSKSDDNGGGGAAAPAAAADTTPVSVKVSFVAGVTDDLGQYADVTVEYMDGSGTVKSEKVNGAAWTKEITAQLPAKLGVRVSYAKKEGVDYKQLAKIKTGAAIVHAYVLLNKAGSVLKNVASATADLGSVDVPGDQIEKYIDAKGKNAKTLLLEYDAKGNQTTGTWKD